jgi:hypothetical protein
MKDELGAADGAYGGRSRLFTPYRKPKNGQLSQAAVRYNTIHGFYRARVEHLFAVCWQFAMWRNVWPGKGKEGVQRLHRRLTVLLNLVTFDLKRKVRNQ